MRSSCPVCRDIEIDDGKSGIRLLHPTASQLFDPRHSPPFCRSPTIEARLAMTAARAPAMRSTAHHFTLAFLTGASSPPELLSRFFSAHDPRIIEHGPPWAAERLPFVGREFRGRNGKGKSGETCDDYFDLLGENLALEVQDSELPAANGLAVDADVGVVLVRCRAWLAHAHTERRWEERFVMVLSEFDERGATFGLLEIWADNLSAWEAATERKSP